MNIVKSDMNRITVIKRAMLAQYLKSNGLTIVGQTETGYWCQCPCGAFEHIQYTWKQTVEVCRYA